MGHYKTLKYLKREYKPTFAYLSFIGFILTAVSLILLVSPIIKAKNAGFLTETKTWLTMPYNKAKTEANQSLKVKMPKKNQRNILVVLYRPSCKDCLKVTSDIKTSLPRNNSKIYYVPSRSTYGQDLAKRSNTKTVPSVIYINKNNNTYTSSLISNYKFDNKTANYYKKLIK